MSMAINVQAGDCGVAFPSRASCSKRHINSADAFLIVILAKAYDLAILDLGYDAKHAVDDCAAPAVAERELDLNANDIVVTGDDLGVVLHEFEGSVDLLPLVQDCVAANYFAAEWQNLLIDMDRINGILREVGDATSRSPMA